MLRKLVLPVMLVMGMSASAGESYNQGKGLIGLEVGYIGSKYQFYNGRIDINDEPITQKIDSNSAAFGLKIGAQSDEFRIFLDGRIWNSEKYNNGTMLGGALQYLIPVDESFNLFLGVNLGSVNVLNSEWDPYMGGDVGFNFAVLESMDVEVGGRYSSVATKSTDMGKITSFYQGYVSFIFKFATGN